MAYPICKSDSGGAVDIWSAFKSPKGTAYTYWDPNVSLSASSHSMNSTTSGALGETMQQLWSESSTEYLIWNDSPPGSSNYNYTVGHSKGIWAWNLDSGDAIILQHSIPQFPLGPRQTSKYVGLGKNAWEYGQHAICLQTNIEELVKIAGLAQLVIPQIYDYRISSKTPLQLSELASGKVSTEPQCNSVSFNTNGNRNITYFAKSTQWNNELYAECVAPALQTNLAVESWIRGSAEGPACSETFHVLDVQDVAFPGGAPFSEANDHSKWAVGENWFCGSDINRMTTQFERGGSAYCFQDSNLVHAMTNVISKTDSC